MRHIRIFRHYLHTPFLIVALFEACIAFGTCYLSYYSRFQKFPDFFDFLPTALIYSFVVILSMMAMGVYESRLREGFAGQLLRTAVSVFLLSTMAMAVMAYMLPSIEMGRGLMFFAAVESFVMIAVSRWLTTKVIQEDSLKKRVLVLGTGHRASKIATRMRRKSDQRAFILHGFLQQPGAQDLISEHGARVLHTDLGLRNYCLTKRVGEIVVAIDERRRNGDSGEPGLPLEELMECKMSGIHVCDVQAFIEREAGKVDVDLLRRGWLVFSDGFDSSITRGFVKRSFDLLACLVLLFFTWPIIIVTALLIALSSMFKDPIFYKQTRVGFDGKLFEVMKFRSMQTNAETSGAVWAEADDPRVTRIGAVIRKSRIDELPQLFNVLKGDMSFVGPRPERPVFVEELTKSIPFYDERHKVKPGITGWAQLCYPYGASEEDAKQKLQYDLYYLKNHSLLLDLIILLQTIEVVLVGEGAR